MPTQRETLLVYAALLRLERDWRGKLILCTGMDRALALAALAAGAATLILEEDAVLLREARQDVTFTVNTLDEALRALKNEIRQGRAITVALAGDSKRWREEINQRGVKPHITAVPNQFVSRTNHTVIQEDIAVTLQERRTRDVHLIDQHPDQKQWLQAAPSLFPRDLMRACLSDN